ncbi:MAG: hypothetical protein GX456_03445 [Verrucomicrobia bacterium]|nr:hypothetical protein [Verrucomicrobiota bacterium]
MQIRRPIIHRLGAAKNRRAPAGRWEQQRRSGARPSSAASIRRPIVGPVSIMQTSRPNIHRLGAGKNARAPGARRTASRA